MKDIKLKFRITLLLLAFIILNASEVFACFSGQAYTLIPPGVIYAVFLLILADLIFLSDRIYKFVIIPVVAFLTYYFIPFTHLSTLTAYLYTYEPHFLFQYWLIPVLFILAIIYTVSYGHNKAKKISAYFLTCLFVITLGFLVIIGGPKNSYIITSGQTSCSMNLKHIGTALEMYRYDNNGQHPASIDKLFPEYLVGDNELYCANQLNNPMAQRCYEKIYGIYLGKYRYEVSDNYENFTLSCAPNNHKVYGSYPVYTNKKGFELVEINKTP